MIVHAQAKINLGLEVLCKRSDGFHDINTLFVRIPLADEIEIRHSDVLACHTEPDLGIREESNLAYRAAALLRERYNCYSGAEIFIKKVIPHGGGLGGGSSDAASVLLALNEMWGLGAPTAELAELAIRLGSDVPFFLHKGAAIGTGRGENLEYFDYELPYRVLLVFPDIAISTAWAYGSLNADSVGKAPTDYSKLLAETIRSGNIFREYFVNDFERVAFAEYPEIGRIKDELYNSGAIFALMSGSGSTVFGLFDSENSIKSALDSLSNYRTFTC